MKLARVAVAMGVFAQAGLCAAPIPGDASQGAELFKSQKCVQCHSVGGEGGRIAPDLGKRTGRAYTPAAMAGLMWNHAPEMWAAMEKAGIDKPRITEDQAAHLFAYFFSLRYFEMPGDAGRGRKVFAEKGCAGCHAVNEATAGGGPPLASWGAPSDAIALGRAMWNHAQKMREAMSVKQVSWPALSSQDLTDIAVYVTNLPGAKKAPPTFAPASAKTGERLYQVKGCADCHKGSLDLTRGRMRSRTLADLTAALWNHGPKMLQMPPELNDTEMRRLIGYLWSIQYFDARGNVARGERIFRQKGCAGCHGPSGPGPSLAGRGEVNSINLVASLWQHGPAMLAEIQKSKKKWPRFREGEVNDLLAYLSRMK